MPAFPQRFGSFVLVEALGFGGVGDICLALLGQAGTEKTCVIKRLHPDLRSAPDLLTRFRHEADLVRRLSHGNLVATLQIGDVEDEPYIAQEFVGGKDLLQVTSVLATAHEPLPAQLCLYIACEVAQALAYVHEFEGLGLIHRDVSPANIRLSFTGEVKLLDFGIAKSVRETFLTQVGHRPPGRPLYMAPELLRAEKGDRRSDVYSLGVVLWGLLARRPVDSPSDGREPRSLPAPSTFNPEIPSALDLVVEKATAQDPSARYEDARAFRTAMAALIPSGFDGEQGLRALLASLFDVDRESRARTAALDRARAMLAREVPSRGDTPQQGHPAQGPEPTALQSEETERARSHGPARMWLMVGILAVFGAAGLFFYRHKAPPGGIVPRPVPGNGGAAADQPIVPIAPVAPVVPVAAPSGIAPSPPPIPPHRRATAAAERPHPPSGTPEREAGQRKPASDDERSSGQRLAADGWEALEGHDAQGAIKLGQAALKAGASDAHFLLGKAYFSIRDLRQALEHLNQARRANPGDKAAQTMAETVQRLLENSE